MQQFVLEGVSGVHKGQRVLQAGVAPDKARGAMIMIHGRGASPEDILGLTWPLNEPDFAYFAPQAAGSTWYPNRFMEPIESNEPNLSSAFSVIKALMAHVAQLGIPPEKTILLGFSQGACLSLEYAARNAQRYGGVMGLSGGLIGPKGIPRDYPRALDGTPVFLGCSDTDFHIPVERVHESAEIMGSLGGQITKRIYPGLGHVINDDEVDFVRETMHGIK